MYLLLAPTVYAQMENLHRYISVIASSAIPEFLVGCSDESTFVISINWNYMGGIILYAI